MDTHLEAPNGSVLKTSCLRDMKYTVHDGYGFEPQLGRTCGE